MADISRNSMDRDDGNLRDDADIDVPDVTREDIAPVDEELVDLGDENDVQETDELRANNGELERILASHQEMFAPLPAGVQFQEDGYDTQEMESASLLHKHYRGRDRPAPDEFKHPDVNDRLDAKSWACILFQDQKDAKDRGRLFGHGLQGQLSGGDKPWLKISWQLSTQNPQIRLHILVPDQEEIICHFPVNCIARSADGSCELDLYAPGHKHLFVPKNSSELKMQHSRSDLMEIRMVLFDEDTHSTAVGAQPSRPAWWGISLSELNSILRRHKGPTMTPLKEYETLIAMLHSSSDISIYRTWPGRNGRPTFDKFEKWVLTAFDAATRGDNDWFARMHELEEGPTIYSADFELAKLDVPRWLVKKWYAEVDEDGQIVSQPQAAKWASYDFSANERCFASSQNLAFQYRAAIERNRVYQSRILESSFQRAEWTISAKFRPHPRKAGIYIVELRTSDNKLLNADRELRPQVDTRLEVMVQTSTFAEDGKYDTYRGVITDDLWDSKAEVVCVVTGPPMAMTDYAIKMASAELLDDPTPSNRWKASIERVAMGFTPDAQGHFRPGCDFPAIILRAPPTIEVTDSLALEVLRDGSEEDYFNAVVQRWGLNAEQMSAADNSAHSESGCSVIHGPPGTGKTKTAMAIAEGHIRVGEQFDSSRRRQVIVCAPSNIAVDAALTSFSEGYNHDEGDIVIVRFRGAFLRAKRDETEQDMDMGGDEDDGEPTDRDLQAAIWELADEKSPFGQEQHEKYSFYLQRRQHIEKWAATKGSATTEHGLAEEAAEYLVLLEKVKHSEGCDKAQRQENKLRVGELEEDLTEWFFKHIVDIVFCTNSTAGHPVLRANYEPKLAIGDEVAVTTLPDAITPLAAFMSSLEGVVFAGDHKQQYPLVASKGCNEWYDLLKTSLYESITMGKPIRNFLTKLVVQHRMHPDISDFISTGYYSSELQNHASTSAITDSWLTMQKLLERLGPAWNRKRRVVFDVSGENVHSELYNGTSSHMNRFEARYIVDFIKAAINEAPPPGGRQLVATDFLVLSPYTGQQQLIRNMLVKERVSVAGSKVRTANLRGIQGEEAVFVVLSMTRNDTNKPLSLGFVTDPNASNVGMSRPKQGLFMFGNFKAWIQASISRAPVLTNQNGRLAKFGLLIRDIQTKGDTVSAGDFLRWRDGEAITAAEFPSLLDSRRAPTVRRIQGGQAANRSGSGAGSLKKSAETQTADPFAIYEKETQKVRKNRRKLKNPARGRAPRPDGDDGGATA